MKADSGGSFATLTHARLRAAQGDVNGAARILRVILAVQPGHDEARRFLAEIENRTAVAHSEIVEDVVPDVTPAATGDLTRRFREALAHRDTDWPAGRLLSWLERTQRNRGARHDR
jgi:hypothetical protein